MIDQEKYSFGVTPLAVRYYHVLNYMYITTCTMYMHCTWSLITSLPHPDVCKTPTALYYVYYPYMCTVLPVLFVLFVLYYVYYAYCTMCTVLHVLCVLYFLYYVYCTTFTNCTVPQKPELLCFILLSAKLRLLYCTTCTTCTMCTVLPVGYVLYLEPKLLCFILLST